MANNVNVKKLEADLWESADLLRAGSKLTSNQYCMPVLGLIFLRYAYSRFKLVEQKILKDRPMRGGRNLAGGTERLPRRVHCFCPRSAVQLLSRCPPTSRSRADRHRGNPLNSLGEVVNNAMELVGDRAWRYQGVLPDHHLLG